MIIETLIVAVCVVSGACWRRCFGGWEPGGVGLPRIVDLIIFGAAAAGVGTIAFPPWPLSLDSALLAVAAIGFAYSWTRSHGPDSNRWAFIKSDWAEQALRYGLFPGVLVAIPFLVKGAWIAAAIMLASGVVAGLAAAMFLTFGNGWKWLPVDPTPHSFADGGMVYNEFALGAILSGGFAVACIVAGGQAQ